MSIYLLNKLLEGNITMTKKQNCKPQKNYISFSTSAKFALSGIIITLILCVTLFILTLMGGITFSKEDLRNISETIINVLFVLAALEVAIFSIPLLDKDKLPQGKEVLLSLLGRTAVIVIGAIFLYIYSYIPLSFQLLDGIFATLIFNYLIISVLRYLSFIMTIFNVQNNS